MTKVSTCIICLFFIFTSTVTAQNIRLSIAPDCRITVNVDNKAAAKEKTSSLNVTRGGKLNISVDNISQTPDLVVALKNAGGANITLNNTSLANKLAISVNDQLKAAIGGQTLDLTKEFSIAAGCRNSPASMVEFLIKPVVQNAGTPAPKVVPDSDGRGNSEPSHEYMPGSAVYDALKLSTNKQMTRSEFVKIIKLYFSEEIDNLEDAKAAAKNNVFLKDFEFNPRTDAKDSAALAEAEGSIFSSLSLSSIGGLDVTGISDALARVLVKRTKQELNALFFEKFKKMLEDYRYRDLRTLFPSTYALLAAMGEEIYDYEKYIQNLREAFKADMTVLDETLPGIIPNHQRFFNSNPALAASLRTACYVAGELKRQVHPGDILDNYPTETLDSISLNWKGAVQTVQLLSTSLRDTTTSDSSYWVSIRYIRELVNNKTAFKIYFGLVYQLAVRNYNKVPFENNRKLTDLLEFLAKDNNYDEYYDEYKTYIFQFAERTETLNRMIKNYQKPASDSLVLEQYKKYFDAAVDLIKQSAAVGRLPIARNVRFLKELPDTLSVYFEVQQYVSDLVIEINRKNYPAAINKVVLVYQLVKTRKETERLKTIEDSIRSLKARGNATAEIKALHLQADSIIRANDILEKLVRYGGFMSAIALAKSSQEIERTLETFALPVGSSRIKRASPFNVSLNAYVGLFTGYEKIQGIDEKFALNSFGVSAPIGVAVSRGHSIFFIKGNTGASSSLFLSIIDIGALTAFRFEDDETEEVPTVNLKNIIAPGVFYSLGFGRTPLSLNIGYQMGPLLRKVDPSVTTVYESTYTRLSVSLNVDIPLFNFYNKSK